MLVGQVFTDRSQPVFALDEPRGNFGRPGLALLLSSLDGRVDAR